MIHFLKSIDVKMGLEKILFPPLSLASCPVLEKMKWALHNEETRRIKEDEIYINIEDVWHPKNIKEFNIVSGRLFNSINALVPFAKYIWLFTVVYLINPVRWTTLIWKRTEREYYS